jgi:hypothetical protein
MSGKEVGQSYIVEPTEPRGPFVILAAQIHHYIRVFFFSICFVFEFELRIDHYLSKLERPGIVNDFKTVVVLSSLRQANRLQAAAGNKKTRRRAQCPARRSTRLWLAARRIILRYRSRVTEIG